MLVPTIMFTAVATLSFIALTRVSLHFKLQIFDLFYVYMYIYT